jgi:hypothetical protein
MAKGKRPVRPAAILTVPIDADLKELIGQAADIAEVPMNEWVAQLCARELKRPDLAKIPRKSFGRPRNETNGHANGRKNGHKKELAKA